VAGLGHASMGNLDLELLGQLLIGLFQEFYRKYVEENDLFFRNAIAIILFL
jgi:hypothetical protein